MSASPTNADQLSLHGQSLIASRRGTAHAGEFHAIDPSTGQTLGPAFHEASPEEIERALTEAATAFADTRLTSPEIRARFLDTVAATIEGLGDGLIQRAHSETGLPPARLQGERARTCAQLRLFAEIVREGSWVDARIDTALPQRQPLPRPDIRRLLVPVGPVVVFGSSNFPLAFSVAGGDTASAFAAGCPVIVKAHRSHPGTSELVGEAVSKAVQACSLPAGLFSMIHGKGSTAGIALVTHPATAAVGFTGSRSGGTALCEAAARRPRPIPVFAEMSSLNPVILLPGALSERGTAIAQGLTASFTLGVGQFCTKPGLIFALAGAPSEAFIAQLAAAVRSVPCATMLSPGIRQEFLENRAKVVGAQGVSIVAAGDAAADAAKNQGQPSVAVTTGAHFLKQPSLATEAFGPFTLVVVCDCEAEVSACLCGLEGQLTATVHGTNSEIVASGRLVSLLERIAGRLIVNSFPTGVEVCRAMNHGGPFPATSDARFTSVGTAALLRFVRPVCYQGFPDKGLPEAIQNDNPLKILRLLDGEYTRAPARERGP